MMCDGISWRSWMMYSPRSVSTGVMPFAFEMIVEADLLGHHGFALGHRAGAERAADVENDAQRILGR